MPQDDKPRRRVGKITRQARRDVRNAYAPAFRDLRQQKREAKDVYEEGISEAGDIQERTQNMLGELMPNLRSSTESIGTDYLSQVGQLNSMLGLQPPTSQEGLASQQMLGTIGSGTLGNLAESQQRNLNYMQSSKRQSVYDQNEMERNYLEGFEDVIRELGNTRFDLRQDMTSQVLSRVDELRNRRFEQRLARRELDIRESIAEDQMGFEKRKYRNRQERKDRAQDFAEDTVLNSIRKESIKDLNKDLDLLNLRIKNLQGKYPGLVKRGDQWGYMSTAGPSGAESFIKVTRATKLMKERRRVRTVLDRKKRRRAR